MANTKLVTRVTNDQKVYNVLKSFNAPSTISQISSALPDIGEQTVRRAVKALMANGFICEAGRVNGTVAVLYIVSDSSTTGDGNLIPHEGGFTSVETFLRLMSSPTIDPLKGNLKVDVLSEEMKIIIRKRMLFAIVTAGEPGFKPQLHKAQESLIKIEEELERILRLVKNFNNSAVWFDQYRDQVAFGVRETQRSDAELYQLCMDFIQGG